MAFRRADELIHPDAGGDRWWFEADAAVDGGRVQLTVELVAVDGGTWHYRTVLAGAAGAGDLVVVDDDDVPPPRAGSLELRTHGLWAEQIVETAFDHVSVGCEAFALRVDPPAGPTVPRVGEPVAFGLDLGWESAGDVAALEPGPGYEIPCVVYGEILVGDARIAVDAAPGGRGHAWGVVGPMRSFSA